MTGLIDISLKRTLAITWKEIVKIRLDMSTVAVILITPIIQIILFGFAIELFPKNIPTVIIDYDKSMSSRKFIQTMQSSNFFNIINDNITEADALQKLKMQQINFILTIPAHFSRDLIKQKQPHMLFEFDGTVPNILGGAVQTVNQLQNIALNNEFVGAIDYLKNDPAFIIDNHTIYNPNWKTANANLPGLIAIILLISLCTISSMTIVEEKTFGTMETLLNSSFKSLEIMVGKYLCFLLIAYTQLICVLYVSLYLLFNINFSGSVFTILLISFPFITSNLLVGLAASTVSKTQLEAYQLGNIITLPSILLSGFIFPFYGMPIWAQWLGETMPTTHYMRVVSGVMLKDYSWTEMFPDIWPMLLFDFVVLFICVISFKRTLD